MLYGLKMQAGPAGPPKIEDIDVRSLRMLDGRLRACHKALGVDMPLE